MVEGTADEVTRASGLLTWTATGAGVAAAARQLRASPDVASIALFGHTLHVSGSDKVRLERVLAPLRDWPDLHWEPASPSLEDVFIHLLSEKGAPE